MKIIAWCIASARESVRKAAGVEPLLSPPLTMGTFQPSILNGYDLVYLKLHGLKDQGYWYGDGYVTACSAEQIANAGLNGCAVFAANCFLPDSPMLKALFDGGAGVVIGGSGINYGGTNNMEGSDLLGWAMRMFMQTGMPVLKSFEIARRSLMIRRRTPAIEDALAFQIFSRKVDS
jgi:hypothetical protein